MKSEREILDEYGTLIVNKILDRYYKGLKREITEGIKNANSQKYNQVFSRLTDEEKDLMREYIIENLNSLVFDLLGLFEENDQFKIYFESSDQRVNLVEISEMLKAELIIENGWIKRFSKEIDK